MVKNPPANAGDMGLIFGLGRPPGVGVCKATLPTLGNRDLGSLRGVLMLCSKAPA